MKNLNEFHANKGKMMLVDGDLLAYKITSALEEPIEWEDDVWTLHCDLDKCKQFWKQSIAYYLQHTNSAHAIIAFSDVSNYRKQIDLEYKSFRKGIRKPIAYKPLRYWIEETHKTISFPFLEGDDALGLLATGKYKDNCVVVSGDKDMRTIPCKLLAGDDLELITKRQADRNCMKQACSGDPTDNYKGIPGVGLVGADKILGDSIKLDDMWEKVVEAYKKQKLTYADALLNARLSRILRQEDINLNTGKIKLWSPKKKL